jgi:hypothetical protein
MQPKIKQSKRLCKKFNLTHNQLQSKLNNCFFYHLSVEELEMYLHENHSYKEEMKQERQLNKQLNNLQQ